MLKRRMFFLALCLLLLLSTAAPVTAQPAGREVQQDSPSYQIMIIPALVRRMCVGDSFTFAFTVTWQEPADEDLPLAPLVPPANGDDIPVVPLPVYQAVVETPLGSVSQAVFPVDQPFESFSFVYNAEQPGQETITVSIEGIASDTFSFEVVESCDYELTFFSIAEEEVDGGAGGFEAIFYGAGEFGASRTEVEAKALEGRGNAKGGLGIWAAVDGAFSCTMDPFEAAGEFEIGGMAGMPTPETMHLTLFFEPLSFPSQMVFNCSMVGFGEMQLPVPIGETVANPDDAGDFAGIILPIDGGVYDISKGKMTGSLTVRRKR